MLIIKYFFIHLSKKTIKNNKIMKLKITKTAKMYSENIQTNQEGQADIWDMIELAIQIGEDNNLYNNGEWNDFDRERCYNKAYEII